MSSQASAELNLQQKLRDDDQIRMEELEEALLEKDQEVQKLQALVVKLQGEVGSVLHLSLGETRNQTGPASGSLWTLCLQVSGKLIDKERTLEEEIQLRERLQLQCKQAERTVDDLTMDLQNTNQAKDDLAKQLKLAQVGKLHLPSSWNQTLTHLRAE